MPDFVLDPKDRLCYHDDMIKISMARLKNVGVMFYALFLKESQF